MILTLLKSLTVPVFKWQYILKCKACSSDPCFFISVRDADYSKGRIEEVVKVCPEGNDCVSFKLISRERYTDEAR